ncbi:Transcription corepressor like [Actinidia chinensis var. chinensis]|uniref:Transcription corepressor like n=1 Tax=Actinidia chinensis var. chinensis TaxID=1590841 RepID=A0A2R6RYH5_ACTCC|nr:Transcription corepressor like [Actinidia chinensis var. chinensis]
MAQPEVSKPIFVILDKSNYRLWSSIMQRFLRGRKLWKYITGDAQPSQFFETDEDDDDDDDLHAQYQSQLEDWDSVGLELHHLHFDLGQTLTDFYNKISNLWNHLAQFEPTWTCPTNTAAFHAYRDRSRLCHFLVALPPDYEHIQASLLHRHPLPIVGQALAELTSEETRKNTMVYQHSQPVLAIPAWALLPPPSQSVRFTSSKNIPYGSQKKYCSFCRQDTYSYEDYRSRLKSRCKGYHNRQTTAVTDSTGSSYDSSSSTFTVADVETIVT